MDADLYKLEMGYDIQVSPTQTPSQKQNLAHSPSVEQGEKIRIDSGKFRPKQEIVI